MVALGEQQDVSWNEFLRRNAHLGPSPQHARVGGEEPSQRLGGFLRLVLLPEAEGPVDQVDHPDGHPQLRHPGEEPDQPSGPQQDGHQVREIRQELQEEGLPPDLLDDVASETAQALQRLVGSEPLRARLQRLVHLVGRHGMDFVEAGVPERFHENPRHHFMAAARCSQGKMRLSAGPR
jgi:hypothetical protein